MKVNCIWCDQEMDGDHLSPATCILNEGLLIVSGTGREGEGDIDIEIASSQNLVANEIVWCSPFCFATWVGSHFLAEVEND